MAQARIDDTSVETDSRRGKRFPAQIAVVGRDSESFREQAAGRAASLKIRTTRRSVPTLDGAGSKMRPLVRSARKKV